MTSWVVSAHAASYSSTVAGRSAQRLVHLPPGVRFYFFEQEGVPLSVPKAWQIYNLVMSANPTGKTYTDLAAIPGYSMFNSPALPDYTISGDNSWIDKHGQSASGIFVMHDEYHQNPLTYYIPAGHSYSLSQFFTDPAVQWKPGDQVFWLACRVWA